MPQHSFCKQRKKLDLLCWLQKILWNSPFKNCFSTNTLSFSSFFQCNLRPLHTHFKISANTSCTCMNLRTKKNNFTRCHILTTQYLFLLLLFLLFCIPDHALTTTLHFWFSLFFFNVHPHWCTSFYKNFPMILIGITYKNKFN